MNKLRKLIFLSLAYGTLCGNTTPTFRILLDGAKQDIRAGALQSALQKLTTALGCKPAHQDADIELGNNLLWLGNQFFDRGESIHALASFRAALSISDQFAAVHHNIAFTLAERFGNHHEALKHYQKSLALKPDNIEAHFCASLSYLATGDLIAGFKEYEYRWQRGTASARTFVEPLKNMWDGNASLWGKTFLIRSEQGLGDTIHFIRFAQLLKDKGAFVIAEVQKPLIKLLSFCPFVDQVIMNGEPLPPFDYQAPLLSLPTLCKTTLQSIPNRIPYLFASPERCDYWHEQLKSEKDPSTSLPAVAQGYGGHSRTGFKIGICWFGDPSHGQVKFMPLKDFLPLFNRPDVCVYSLQMHDGIEQLKDLPAHITVHQFDASFDKKFGSFIDTAAVMKEMDLVICVDTSVAHVAGGLGVPVWIALPFPAEWRWLMDRHDSPWYPTMTLFRQTEANNWKPVMEQMLKSLDGLIAVKKSLR